jgi:hypothetical protein
VWINLARIGDETKEGVRRCISDRGVVRVDVDDKLPLCLVAISAGSGIDMYVVRVDALEGKEPHYRAFAHVARAHQSLNAGSWKVYRGLATAAYLFDVPNEDRMIQAIEAVRRGFGAVLARNREDGLPPHA